MEHEIEQVIARYTAAIHSQDEKEFKSLWTGEPTNTLISGSSVFTGLETICQDFLIGILQKRYSTIALANVGLTSYSLTGDVAVAVFRYHTVCTLRDTGEPYGIAGVETQVMKKTGAGWKIAHIQYHGSIVSQ